MTSSEWLPPVETFAAREKADIAVVMFGANDRIDMREGRATLRFRSEEWRAEYAARIDKILDRARRRRAARAVAAATRSRAASATPTT